MEFTLLYTFYMYYFYALEDFSKELTGDVNSARVDVWLVRVYVCVSGGGLQGLLLHHNYSPYNIRLPFLTPPPPPHIFIFTNDHFKLENAKQIFYMVGQEIRGILKN